MYTTAFLVLVWLYGSFKGSYGKDYCKASLNVYYSPEVTPGENFDVPLPVSDDEWDTYCRYLENRIESMEKCFELTFAEDETYILHAAFFKAMEVFKDVCVNNTTKEEYLSSSRCLREDRARCGQILEKIVPVLKKSKSKSPEYVVRTICCSWDEFVKCQSTQAEQLCGLGKWIQHILHGISGTLFSIHCTGYDVISARCSASNGGYYKY